MKSFFGAIIGALIGAGSIFTINHFIENPFLDYYTVENAVAVSPHDLRMEMDRGITDTIVVDLRSRGEYAREHIRGAINIPGIDNDIDAQSQEARIFTEFEKLPKDKRIIIHCYTHYCMLAKHVGLMLAKQGIYVHELNIGWNEWRNEWDLWNGKGTESTMDITKYLEGTEIQAQSINSGNILDIPPCTTDGLAGC